MVGSTRARLFIALALNSALLAPRVSRGQTPTERAVRAVVDSFFTAIERERWDSAAAFVDLGRFEPFFQQRVSSVRSALPQREMTVEDFMANDSTMPRAVAEWQVERMKKYRQNESFGDMSGEFAGVRTQHEFFALTVGEAAARWMEAQDMRTQMREAWRRAGCSLASLPPALPATKRTVLAVAVANDSTAFVVHTDDRFGGDPMGLSGGERTMVLHRIGGRWRIQLRQDLLRPVAIGFGFGGCPGPRRDE
jgi:hypothetical protein